MIGFRLAGTFFCLLALFIACQTQNKSKPSSSSLKLNPERLEPANVSNLEAQSFTGRWVQVVKKDGRWVHHTHCDASPREITIEKDRLIDFTGQEKIACALVSMKHEERQLVYESASNCSYGSIFRLATVDKAQGIYQWSIYKGIQFYAVKAEILERFAKSHAPCLECFSEQECSALTTPAPSVPALSLKERHTKTEKRPEEWGEMFFEGPSAECMLRVSPKESTLECSYSGTGFVDRMKLKSKSATQIVLVFESNVSGANFSSRPYDEVVVTSVEANLLLLTIKGDPALKVEGRFLNR